MPNIRAMLYRLKWKLEEWRLGYQTQAALAGAEQATNRAERILIKTSSDGALEVIDKMERKVMQREKDAEGLAEFLMQNMNYKHEGCFETAERVVAKREEDAIAKLSELMKQIDSEMGDWELPKLEAALNFLASVCSDLDLLAVRVSAAVEQGEHQRGKYMQFTEIWEQREKSVAERNPNTASRARQRKAFYLKAADELTDRLIEQAQAGATMQKSFSEIFILAKKIGSRQEQLRKDSQGSKCN